MWATSTNDTRKICCVKDSLFLLSCSWGMCRMLERLNVSRIYNLIRLKWKANLGLCNQRLISDLLIQQASWLTKLDVAWACHHILYIFHIHTLLPPTPPVYLKVKNFNFLFKGIAFVTFCVVTVSACVCMKQLLFWKIPALTYDYWIQENCGFVCAPSVDPPFHFLHPLQFTNRWHFY